MKSVTDSDDRQEPAKRDLLLEVNRSRRTTLVLVTHDGALAALVGSQLALADGKPVPDRTTVTLRADVPVS